MNNNLRWGILSTANIARKALIPAIQNTAQCTISAIASRSEEKAQQMATDFGIPRVHSSYQALLDDPEVDAVYIPLPNSMHKDWVIKAAAAGKHILCEKPLGLNARECLEMAAAAERNEVTLMEAFMYRFHPRTEAVFDLVQAQDIGELRLLRASFSFKVDKSSNIRLNPSLGGGSLMDVGCYCVNVCRSLMQQEPLEAQAFASFGKSGVDEQLIATLRFPGERYAQFYSALDLPRRQSYEVIGEQGHLEIDAAFVPGTDDVEIQLSKANAPLEKKQIQGADEYQCMVEHFRDCLKNNTALRYDAYEASANMRVIEALYRSALNHGKPEPVGHFSM